MNLVNFHHLVPVNVKIVAKASCVPTLKCIPRSLVQMGHLQMKQDLPHAKYVQLVIGVLIRDRRQSDAVKDIIVLLEQHCVSSVLLDTGKTNSFLPKCFLLNIMYSI